MMEGGEKKLRRRTTNLFDEFKLRDTMLHHANLADLGQGRGGRTIYKTAGHLIEV
jgi:hypothetical protein